MHKSYPATIPNEDLFAYLVLRQTSVHKWGEDNQVAFDLDKEAFCILSHKHGEGKSFKLLGTIFDNKLIIGLEINRIIGKASGKTKAILRTQRFYNTSALIA